MRRVLLAIFIIIGIHSAWSQSLLDRFESSLKALGTYRVEFEVGMDGYSTTGEYIVSGNNFYLIAEGIEYYVADGIKYEVNRGAKEIVMDTAASLGSDLLSNPAQGFSVLARDFNAEQMTIDGCQALRLTTKQGGGDTILVVADSRGALPQSITYSYGSASMVIKMRSITSCNKLPLFDRSNYADFEVVDMR